jgi:hypothetical protein
VTQPHVRHGGQEDQPYVRHGASLDPALVRPGGRQDRTQVRHAAGREAPSVRHGRSNVFWLPAADYKPTLRSFVNLGGKHWTPVSCTATRW